MTEPKPHETHNEITGIIINTLIHTFGNKADRVIALESIVLGVLASVTRQPEKFEAYLALMSEGALERLKAHITGQTDA